MLEPNPNLTTDRRCSSPFKPSSGCTVCTKELKREAELAIRTFQNKHENAPVFVIADDEAAQYLNSKKFNGSVTVSTRPLIVPETVKKQNDYHRADAILWKMDVLDVAVKEKGDSVFFDADIVFLRPLSGPDDCEVALSHNLTCIPADKDAATYGVFNAGMVWTCNPKFAPWWKQLYLRGDGFYEQLGMNLTPRMFRTSYFDITHNYGFWRGPLGGRRAHSLHVHLDTTLDATMAPFMINSLYRFRTDCWRRMKTADFETGRLARNIMGHPKKIFFIHYGKAGGVYVNHLMKNSVIPDYQFFDSWKLGFGRDWEQHELHGIIDLDDDIPKFLHQHHLNTQRDNVLQAKERGWKTFMFLRDPREVICSLYFWRKKYLDTKDEDPIFFTKENLSLKEFWYKVINEDKKLWTLPDYTDDVDEIALFSHDNLCVLTKKWFGYAPDKKHKMNESSNPGVVALVQQGEITQEMLTDLEATPEFQAFIARCNL